MQPRASLVIAAGLLAMVAVSGCAASPAPRASAIPESLQNLAYSRCVNRLDQTKTADFSVSIGWDPTSSTWVDVGPLSDADATGTFSTIWHVHVSTGRVAFQADADGASAPAGEELAGAQEVGSALFDCVSAYRFQSQSEFPASRAALLQLYRYDVGVLWPCLTAHGVTVGTAPSRQAFLTQADAYAAYPVPPSGSDVEVERRLAAAAACPAIPQYLARR